MLFYKLAKENEGLFKVLYEVASDSNSRAQFQNDYNEKLSIQGVERLTVKRNGLFRVLRSA